MRGVAEIVVKGVLANKAGDALEESDIVAFDVNGQRPEIDLASGRWWLTVPVSIGSIEVELVARVTDVEGEQTTAAVALHNQPERADYLNLELEPSGDSLLVRGSGSLRRLNLTTLEETHLADLDSLVEEGNLPGLRRSLVADPNGDRAYLLAHCTDWELCGRGGSESLMQIALDSGEVTSPGRAAAWPADTERYYYYFDVLGDQMVYTGLGDFFPDWDGVNESCGLALLDIASGESKRVIYNQSSGQERPGVPVSTPCPGTLILDARENRAIVADQPLGRGEYSGLYTVDLNSGDTIPVSGDEIGQGPPLNLPEYLYRMSHGESVLAVSERDITEVELATGDRRRLLSEPNLPEDRTDVSFDELQNRLLIASGGQRISSLELAGGELDTIVSFTNAVGQGPDFSANLPLMVDRARERLLLLDDGDQRGDGVLEVDLGTLQRNSLAGNLDLHFSTFTSTYLDDESEILYLENWFDNELLSLNLQTGQQRVLVDDSDGQAPELDEIKGMCLDRLQGLLYLATRYVLRSPPHDPWTYFSGVMSVDIVSGARELVAHDVDVEGGILCDVARDRLLLLVEREGLVSMHPATGEREGLLSVYASNPGIELEHMAWDSVEGQVLFGLRRNYTNYSTGQEYARGVLSLDMDSGDFTSVLETDGKWAYDRETELFYTNQVLFGPFPQRGQLNVIDRRSGDRVVISHPER